MILSFLRITPKQAKSAEAVEILMSVVGPSMAEPGCHRCEVAWGASGESVYLLEEWDTLEDFHRHIRSDLYVRVLSAIEYSSQAPELAVFQSLEPAGLELIEHIRTHPEEDPDALRIDL